MQVNYEQTRAIGSLRGGLLQMKATCPVCRLETVMLFNRRIRIERRDIECSHFVSARVEPTRIWFNFRE
jgi:hypothetical protein